jgi:hypothetical protein
MQSKTTTSEAMRQLERFVGTWELTVDLPGAPPGRATFEWALGGQYLVQRTEIPHPEVPDSLIVVAYDEQVDRFTQHYFDSRGVVRIYRMTLADRDWTLLRDELDFTPLDFRQRFVGTFSDDGDRIDGQWQSGNGDDGWKKDFDLHYVRIV